MKTVVSNAAGARTRLAWIACAALTLAACTGPGLEPPNDRSGGTGTFSGKPSDAGAQHQQGSGDMSATGTGGSKGSTSGGGTGGSSNPANGGGSGGGSGGNPPVSTQDAGVRPSTPGTKTAAEIATRASRVP